MNKPQPETEESKKAAYYSDENFPATPGRGFKSLKRKFSPHISQATQVVLLNTVLIFPSSISTRI